MKNLQFDKPQIRGIEIKRCSLTEQSYKEHLHEELSIGFIEDGETVVCFNGEEYSFSKGEGIIIPPFVSHICKPKDINNWKFVMMYIDSSYYEGQINSLKPRKLTGTGLTKLNDLVRSMSVEYDNFHVENKLIEFLSSYIFMEEKIDEICQLNTIEKIYNHIKANFLEDITLESLETSFNLNKFSIIRGFKSTYNITPSSFQLQLKVAYAKGLLGKGMNVLDVCSEVGFYDQSHFIREFKKAHGITPLKYQRDVIRGI
ncbi:MAG: AraC family transcriptional regulator [Clostridium sp.]